MSEISNVIAELRRLKEIKDENLACMTRRDEINDKIDDESQDALHNFATKLNDLKNSHSENLEPLVPTSVYPYDKTIPVCETENIKLLYPLAGLALFVSFVLFILTSWFNLNLGGLIGFLCIAGIFVGGGIWLFKNNTVGDYFKWKKERKEWFKSATANEVDKQDLLNKFKAFDDKFFSEIEAFSQEEDQTAEEYVKYKESLEAPYTDELNMLYDKMQNCVNQLVNSEILHKDYIPYLDDILRNLETGRADSLKESINIALEDERKDNEESARRQEARRQEEILQEQAYQNKLHNMEMQRKADDQAREARQHAAAMEAQAKIQAQETRKLREEIKRQNQNNKRY